MPDNKSLISDEYRAAQNTLHRTDFEYGSASTHMAQTVIGVLNEVRPAELLDYGAGKGRLEQALKQNYSHPLDIRNYDPAIPEWAATPEPCEFVCCIDVLEHIEPDLLENVLDDLQRVTLQHGYFSICNVPAIRTLPDGRNAHLIQQHPKWWLPKLMARFELLNFYRLATGFWVIIQKENKIKRDFPGVGSP